MDENKLIEEMTKNYKLCNPCEMFDGYVDDDGNLDIGIGCSIGNDCTKCGISTDLAKVLIKENYRKIPKDSMVITKEEYDALKMIEKYHITSCGKNSVVLTEREYEIAMTHQYDVGFGFGCKQARKDTAIDILQAISTASDDDRYNIWSDLCERYGVEVE